jgi:hypothetical protein
MLRIVHIINPFVAPPDSEAALSQPVACASLRRAVAEAAGSVVVRLLCIGYAEDAPAMPEGFERLPNLQRSICDLGSFRSPRKLPVFRDVLEAAVQAADCDYLIYTNADIAVMPGFYKAIAAYAAKGYDAFAINRRRISGRFTRPEELELMYAEAGETHTGYDTLVFKRELFAKFTLGDVCIGIPFFDTVLMHNFYAHAQQFRLFTGKHLTFHAGMELVKRWGDADQCAHNRREYHKVLHVLRPLFRVETFPGAALWLPVRHFKWLMNPTFHYPTMFRLDLSQLRRKRRPYPPREQRRLSERWYNVMIRWVNFPDEE